MLFREKTKKLNCFCSPFPPYSSMHNCCISDVTGHIISLSICSPAVYEIVWCLWNLLIPLPILLWQKKKKKFKKITIWSFRKWSFFSFTCFKPDFLLQSLSALWFLHCRIWRAKLSYSAFNHSHDFADLTNKYLSFSKLKSISLFNFSSCDSYSISLYCSSCHFLHHL